MGILKLLSEAPNKKDSNSFGGKYRALKFLYSTLFHFITFQLLLKMKIYSMVYNTVCYLNKQFTKEYIVEIYSQSENSC